MNEALNTLLQHPAIWRGGENAGGGQAGLPSGIPSLDALLPGGGWPVGALTEFLLPREGVGEMSVVMPALARLSQQGRWLAWIAPPYIPYAPALAVYGVNLSRVLVVHPRLVKDALWAVEQALRCGTCGAVLAWPRTADHRSLRRLQLAAEEGRSLGLLFRPGPVVGSSPAALRLRLAPVPGGVTVHLIKRRGGGQAAPLFVDLDHALAESLSAATVSGGDLPGKRDDQRPAGHHRRTCWPSAGSGL